MLRALGLASLTVLASPTVFTASGGRVGPQPARTAPDHKEAVEGFRQQAEVSGYDSSVGDCFGIAVAVSGSTMVVGAPWHAGQTGAAYVFTEVARGWQPVAELVGSYTAPDDQFGYSVGISGSTIVVGAGRHGGTGAAYVFQKSALGMAPDR